MGDVAGELTAEIAAERPSPEVWQARVGTIAVKAKFDLALEWTPERSALGRAFGKLRQRHFWQAKNLKSRGV
jgi:hypothetical protein